MAEEFGRKLDSLLSFKYRTQEAYYGHSLIQCENMAFGNGHNQILLQYYIHTYRGNRC